MHLRALAVCTVLAACGGSIDSHVGDAGAGKGGSGWVPRSAAGSSGAAGQSPRGGTGGAGGAAGAGAGGKAAESGTGGTSGGTGGAGGTKSDAGEKSEAGSGGTSAEKPGATKLVGVGSFGLRGRSDDAASWAYCGNAASGDEHTPDLLRAVAYGEGVFIAVGGDANGKVMRSLDGEHWDEDVHPLNACPGEGYPSSCSNWMGAVAYDNGVWLAGGGNGATMRSEDAGRTWKGVHGDFPEKHIRAMGAGAGRFIAGTDGGGLYVTADRGESWHAKSPWSSAVNSDFLQIAFGNDAFVAYSEEGTACFVSSDKGDSWQPCASAAEGGTSFLFDGENWVAALSKAYATSPNALEWTRHTVTSMPKHLLFDGSTYFGRSDSSSYRGDTLDALQRIAMNVEDFRAWTLGRVLAENLPVTTPAACTDKR
ncbi:MAG TPA: hypothetical protein VFN67_30385 [Polyangiales bacterium]|nr:hypothetical protein [Polyangiales bacterium]